MARQNKIVKVGCKKCGTSGRVRVEGPGHIRQLGQTHEKLRHNVRSAGFSKRGSR